MKSIFVIFFIILSGFAPILSHANSIENFSELEKGLSPFWAQELIGADFIRGSIISEKVKVGVLDLSFAGYSQVLKDSLAKDFIYKPSTIYSPHGAAVAALLGHRKIGVAKNMEFKLLSAGLLKENLLEGLDQVEKAGITVVNISAGISHFKVSEKIDQLADRKIIFILAAGNSARRSPKLDPTKEKLHAIIVGSMELDGSISLYSQEGENVALYAPGANPFVLSLQVPFTSELASGQETNQPPVAMGFGMTSAASPLVAGAVVNLKSLLPELSYAQAKNILIRSGTSLRLTEGKVMLNAWRAELAARRLQKKKDWIHELDNPEIYNFKSIADIYKRLAAKEVSNANKLLFLRKAFLLDPSAETAKKISKVYQDLGLEKNAQFYENF